MKHSFLLLTSLFFLAACQEFGTPKGVVKAVMYAAKKDDLKLFISTLDGQALQQYGNAQSFDSIKKTLQNYDKFEVEVLPDYLEETLSVDERLRTYEAFIYSDITHHIFDLTVKCWVKRYLYYPPHHPCHPRKGLNSSLPAHQNCPPHHERPEWREDSFCQITEIQ